MFISIMNLRQQIYNEYKINKYKENILNSIKIDVCKKYEFTNALERLFISLLQTNTFPSRLEYDNIYVEKFIKELTEKYIYKKNIINIINIINNCYEEFDKLVKYKDFIIHTTGINPEIDYDKGYVKYLDLIIYLPICRLLILKNILYKKKFLTTNYINNFICLTVIKYDNILNRGNQWRINMDFYNNLYKKYKIDIEGFASPLNAVFIDRGIPFCSIYKSDYIFGSIGNFFNLSIDNIKNKTISINPPFIESILNNISDIVLNWINKTKVRLLIIVPCWQDSYFYKSLIESKQLKIHKVYNKQTLPIEHVKDKYIKVINNNFVISFFMLSNF